MSNSKLTKEEVTSRLHQSSSDHGLPASCYTSTAFQELETDTVFRHNWHCLGRCDEIPEPGDFFTLDFIGEPLLVIRSQKNEVSVLSNVCRHRGMPVAAGKGNTKRLRCPYHAWTYNLDGTLRSAPLVSKELLNANCNLPVLNSVCWQGFIFFSFDSDASWPAASLSSLDTHVANYHMDEMHYAFHIEEVWECNWKSLIENFMDGYHLSVVHPQTLHPLTPTSLCKKLPGSDAYTAYAAPYARTAPERENYHPDVTETERRQSQLFCVFPSLVASLSADTLVYLSVQPISDSQVFVKWGISSYESDLSKDALAERIEKWKEINHEDHDILQRLHAGLQSKHFSNGPLARDNFEGTLRDFHQFFRQQFSPDHSTQTASAVAETPFPQHG